MKRIISSVFWGGLLGGACVFLFSETLMAETRYVREIIYVTLREAPGTDQPVLAKLISGQILEVVEAGEEWTHVRLPDGKQGWVLTPYLIKTTPNRTLLEQLQKKYKFLQGQADLLLQENKTLKTALKTKDKQLSTKDKCKPGIAAGAKVSGDKKKQNANGYFELKSDYEKAVRELAQVKQKAAKYEKALAKIEFRQDVKWFISGAGVLIFGLVIGFIARPRRKPSMY